MNRLYYGDNLDVLRDHIASDSVDLIYLDPPFNSNASYNILFKSPTGSGADASIQAFDDTWVWGPAANAAMLDITQSGNHALHTLMQAMQTAIGQNAMMAYLAMMAVRLIEKRLREGYGEAAEFETIGVPRDLASARRLAQDDPHQFQQWIALKLGGWPWQGGKKGGDRGVDGYFYYIGAGGATRTGVISVKAGNNVNPGMLRDLWGVMQRDGHELGLFVCAASPTRGMVEEAAAHGLIETEFGRFPALQVFTLAELFEERSPRLPPLVSANRKASRVETRRSHQEGAQGAFL